jgi:hypothetical protein
MTKCIRLHISAFLVGMVFVGAALAQTPAAKTNPLVGTWQLVSQDVTTPDGKSSPVLGANPAGMAIYSADGHVSVMTRAKSLPNYASNNRMIGTPDEYKAMGQGSNAYYGTYAMDEAAKVLTFKIEGATFPNWDGQEQKRAFTLEGDTLTYKNTSGSRGAGTTTLVWQKIH